MVEVFAGGRARELVGRTVCGLQDLLQRPKPYEARKTRLHGLGVPYFIATAAGRSGQQAFLVGPREYRLTIMQWKAHVCI